MRRRCAILLAAFFLASCHEGPTTVQPSPPAPISPTDPAFLTAGATIGSGDRAGHAAITVKVQNGSGAPLKDIAVTFQTDQGTIDPPRAMTLADGTTSASLTASATATVVVSAGALSQKLLVVAQPPPPTPPPSVPPITPPPAPGMPRQVVLNVTPGATGTPTTFAYSTSSGVVQATWTFGDGSAAVTTTTNTTSHVYTSAGQYIAGVTVLDNTGQSAAATISVTITDLPPPIPPPPPSYAVTVGASPTSVIIGSGSTITATASAQNGAPPPTTYTFDCTSDGTVDFTTTAPTNFASCTYPSAGPFTATVRVTDGGSVVGAGSVNLTVTTPPLFVNIVSNTVPIRVNLPASFTATVSSLGPIPTSLTWEWDHDGDGTTDFITTGASPNTRTTTYVSQTPVAIKVTVRDTATGRSASSTLPIAIAP